MALREVVSIPHDGVVLTGDLAVPDGAPGLVIFAHGSGSSRSSPRNTFVASGLRQRGMGTLLFDLLTREEDVDYEMRFDIDLLTLRLEAVTRWAAAAKGLGELAIGYFGASTGAAAALRAAADLPDVVRAVVSRGGRPDLAIEILPSVQAPTLLIVGGFDEVVIELNRTAYARLGAQKGFEVVPGATHLFEEPGALEKVAKLAGIWFGRFLKQPSGEVGYRR